jgi:galactokinase
MMQAMTDRFDRIADTFTKEFGRRDLVRVSVPGRVELGGNHTDHNHGRVLAAAIDLDTIAVAAPNGTSVANIISEGYPGTFVIDTGRRDAVANERGHTNALMRGIAARLSESGYAIGGFDAVVTSDVLPGSGLSSSASFEVTVATIFNHLFNYGKIPTLEIALSGQVAENDYFGKPCGLMDQIACATGGIVAIDFKEAHSPEIEQIDAQLSDMSFRMLIVNTGGGHEDLTDEYAAVNEEMRSVARAMGFPVCRNIQRKELMRTLTRLRSVTGDRALLRALHFIDENERVADQVAALKANDMNRFLTLVNASGQSSFKWLQNIYSVRDVTHQGIALALNLTERYIAGTGTGACRVHGGGFAGTILTILPEDQVEAYTGQMNALFGENSIIELNVRSEGAVVINESGAG